MSKTKLKTILKALSEARRYCDNQACDICIFRDQNDFGCCIFFAKPYHWEIDKIEDNYDI